MLKTIKNIILLPYKAVKAVLLLMLIGVLILAIFNYGLTSEQQVSIKESFGDFMNTNKELAKKYEVKEKLNASVEYLDEKTDELLEEYKNEEDNK